MRYPLEERDWVTCLNLTISARLAVFKCQVRHQGATNLEVGELTMLSGCIYRGVASVEAAKLPVVPEMAFRIGNSNDAAIWDQLSTHDCRV